MAEPVTDKHRWTDKPMAQLALWTLRTAAGLALLGVGWLVSKAVANESTDTRQDVVLAQHQKQIEEQARQEQQDRKEILDDLHEIKADLKALRK